MSAPASSLPGDSVDEPGDDEAAKAANRSTLLLRAAPVIFLFFWSGGFAAGKVGITYTGPMTFLAVRYTLVLLVLLPLLIAMRPHCRARRPNGFIWRWSAF